MDRRDFLRYGLLAFSAPLLPRFAAASPSQGSSAGADGVAFYVPGNVQNTLYFEGVKIDKHPVLTRGMREFDGHPVLLTRVDASDGSVLRAILPVLAHSIEVHPNRTTGVVNGQNSETMVAFDPHTLDLQAFIDFEEGVVGGGHSDYLPDDATMVVTERLPYGPFSGSAENHYGFVTIRENSSLKLLERYSCGGIAPHDINLLEDGKHAAVSNYGSTNWPVGSVGLDRYRVEPSVTVLEVASGKIVERYVPPKPNAEYRHLAAASPSRVFGLQNREDHVSRYHEIKGGGDELYRTKLAKMQFTAGASLPVVHVNFEEEPTATLLSTDAASMLRGQSIRYEPVHDEVIATFPESDCVVVFSAVDSSVVRVHHTDRDGLFVPRGVALHPDGKHYVVAGDHENIYVYERGTHKLKRDMCVYPSLYRHSHMTAA
jgi:hypothetical protein